ncbi:RagB/SusD family nutrient uptake outer membrane protein [Bacteroides thetaiotaomicron]|nr:RagB/SusD family nutrient uptake outer membrane protein [Bacteroides thetaiotaomicron]
MTQKFVDPVTEFYTAGGSTSGTSAPTILFRLAELYLNVAECHAALGNTQEAIDALNPVRERAGIPKLTLADITNNMTIKDWVHNERFVELWNEGHRFFDVRRWAEGGQVLWSKQTGRIECRSSKSHIRRI